jgi:hypothetical protein
MLKQFYEKVLPSQGVYCISGIDKNKKITNRFVETLDALVTTIEGLKSSELNIFVAPGSFGGHSRRAENSAFLRSFFVDLDVGANKAYDTKEDALDALEYLREQTELPPPTVVDSGGGIHAYWTFDEDIPSAEWKPCAERFKALVSSLIPIDPVVTADSARIMRSPYTVNYKYATPVDTEVLFWASEEYDFSAFRDFLGVDSTTPSLMVVPELLGVDEDTLAILKQDNIESVFQVIAEKSLDDVGCAQIKHILMNPATVSEPMWRVGLGIARACVDWEESIQLMSEGHPDYSPQRTYEKAQQTISKKTGKPMPNKCEYFEEHNPGGCKGCPFRGKITNPLALGRKLKEAETDETNEVRPPQGTEAPIFPAYLKPFVRGANGGVYYFPPPTLNKDGKKVENDPILLINHDFYPIKRMYSPTEGECLLMRAEFPRDPKREFLLPMKHVYAVDKFKEIVSTHGVNFNLLHVPHLVNYIRKWSDYMISLSGAEQMRQQMGWTQDRQSFVVGHAEILKNKEVVKTAASPMVNMIAKAIKTEGSYSLWKEAANKLNMPGFEMHMFGLFVGLGSPLMGLTSTSGAAICYMGKSGSAKTGALYAALSIYGNPKDLMLSGEKSATDNALTGWYLGLQNIVLGVDEASNKRPEHLSDLLYKVSQGKGKLRLSGTTNAIREIEHFASLIMFMTSNQSMYDKLTTIKASPDGEVARLLEFIVSNPKPLIDHPELGREIFDTFRTNYGHAIYDYINYYFAIGEEAVRAKIAKWMKRFHKDFGDEAAYRFYENLICACMAGGEMAKEAGIIDVDLDRIYKVIVTEVIAIRDKTIRVNKVDYKDMVGEFMLARQNGVLVIRDQRVAREPHQGLVARIDVDNGMYYVSKSEMKKHLAQMQISVGEFEFALKQEKVLTYIGKQRLSNGWSGVVATPVAVYGFKIEIPSELLDGI